MKDILEIILEKIKKTPDEYQAYEDLLLMSEDTLKDDKAKALKYLRELSKIIEEKIKSCDDELMVRLYNLHKRVLLAAAPLDLTLIFSTLSGTENPIRSFMSHVGRC